MWGNETQMFHFFSAFLSGSYMTLFTGLCISKGGLCSSTGNGYHCLWSWALAINAMPSVKAKTPAAPQLFGVRTVLSPFGSNVGIRERSRRRTGAPCRKHTDGQ